MDGSAQLSTPLSPPRPRCVRLIDGLSQKHGSRLRCVGRDTFDQRIRLEADPDTLTFCERPVAPDQGENERIVDFWVRSRAQATLLFLGDECPTPHRKIGSTSAPIRSVPPAQLATARVWIANCERMPACKTACHSCLSDAPIQAVVDFVSAPTHLSYIEQRFAPRDPILVRTAVFSLLHRGRLRAPQLLTMRRTSRKKGPRHESR
jgi:hypothetical protein